nr:MAG TPA: hypothetical protein [Caudoviricetes sp.]
MPRGTLKLNSLRRAKFKKIRAWCKRLACKASVRMKIINFGAQDSGEFVRGYRK